MQANNTGVSAALLMGMMLLASATPLLAKELQQTKERQQTIRQMRESGEILPLEKIFAAAKAIKPGEILETELEQRQGMTIYEVEILDAAGQVWELKLDAKTGKLIKLENEGK